VPIAKNRAVYEENYATFTELVKLMKSIKKKGS
jgi:hypothetical protein